MHLEYGRFFVRVRFFCYFFSYVVVYLARLSNAEIPWSLEQNCISRAFYSNFSCRLRLSQTWSQFTFLFILSHFFLAFSALRCAYSCCSLFLIGCKAISYIKRTIKNPEIPITLIHLKSNWCTFVQCAYIWNNWFRLNPNKIAHFKSCSLFV